jgi:hypothetical protein
MRDELKDLGCKAKLCGGAPSSADTPRGGAPHGASRSRPGPRSFCRTNLCGNGQRNHARRGRRSSRVRVPKMLRPTSPVAALAEPKLSMALPQMAESTPSPATTRGFSILVATALPESLRLPCESISSMMMITSPSPMPPPALQAQTPAPRMTAPRAAKSKSRSKSKLVAHEPQAGLPWSGLSWWQSLLSIRPHSRLTLTRGRAATILASVLTRGH